MHHNRLAGTSTLWSDPELAVYSEPQLLYYCTEAFAYWPTLFLSSVYNSLRRSSWRVLQTYNGRVLSVLSAGQLLIGHWRRCWTLVRICISHFPRIFRIFRWCHRIFNYEVAQRSTQKCLSLTRHSIVDKLTLLLHDVNQNFRLLELDIIIAEYDDGCDDNMPKSRLKEIG